jgi:hypothetical protein
LRAQQRALPSAKAADDRPQADTCPDTVGPSEKEVRVDIRSGRAGGCVEAK